MSAPHRARRLAVQGLCCLDVQGPQALPMVREFLADSREAPGVVEAAEALLEAAAADRAECDRLLVRHAHHWDLSRLALVDRNILRLAAHELRFRKAPVAVVIDEAIRIAREFSTAESPRFVNGVLDAIARHISGDAGDDGGDNKTTSSDQRR